MLGIDLSDHAKPLKNMESFQMAENSFQFYFPDL